VEALARRSLADVRAAVSNYREVTLAGELATGRELLRAAGITAELPSAVDVVDSSHHEVFGWVVREGLTNLVRHAHASCCVLRLTTSSVEIEDDGVGGDGSPGNGLTGLRERVAALGGVVDAGPRQPTGGACESRSPEQTPTRDDPSVARRRPGADPQRLRRLAGAPGGLPGGGFGGTRCSTSRCPASTGSRWQARGDSSSRTRHPSSSPRRSAAWPPENGSSIRRWPPNRSPAAVRR
jgi:hypothetical protein